MTEFKTQRRPAGRFAHLVESETDDGRVRVVHGPLKAGGIDVVQSIVVLAASVHEARELSEAYWSYRVERDLLEAVMQSAPRTVDREAGVIRDVLIVGLEAPLKNRRYAPDGLKRAVPLYEGISVNINHPKTHEMRETRDVRDRFGKLMNCRFVEGQGIRGDLHYLKTHEQAAKVTEAAERMPDQIGLSHHAFGPCRMDRDTEVVESIRVVKCVDLVSDPATTKGLYEDNNEQSREALSILNDPKLSKADKSRRFAALLESTEAPDPKAKDKRMDPKEITLEMLESRTDLLAALNAKNADAQKVKELTESNKTLTLKIDELTAANKVAARKTAVDKLLTEAKLPTGSVSDLFRGQCEAAADDATVKALIEDRRKAVGAGNTPKARAQTPAESAGRQEGSLTMGELVSSMKG